MATKEKLALELDVDGAKIASATTSIKSLKQELKDAKNELLQFEAGSEGFARAQARVSALADRIGDLGDSVRIQGTGVERLGQSFGLLTQSLTTGDLERARLAFTGIGQAMSAIPIFLLITALQYLYENFDKVKEVIFGTTNEVDANAYALKALKAQTDANTASLNSYIDTLKKELDTLELSGASIDKQIAKRREITTAVVGSLDQQIQKKKEDISATELQITTNAKQLEQARLQAAGVSAGYEATVNAQNNALQFTLDNQKKELSALESLTVDKTNILTKANSEEKKLLQDAYDKAKVLDDKLRALYAARASQFNTDIANRQQYEEDTNAARIADEQAAADKEIAIIIKAGKDELDFSEAIKEAEAADDKAAAQAKIDLSARVKQARSADEQAYLNVAKIGASAAQDISDAFYNYQLSKATGNNAKLLQLQKEQFNVNKAFQIGQATIDGIRSVTGALANTATLGPFAAGALAIANGVLAAAQIAKIAATQFNPGTTSTGSNTSIPNLSTGSAPRIDATPSAQSTLLDSSGHAITQAQHDQNVIKAYVVANDVTNVQKNVARVQRQARV